MLIYASIWNLCFCLSQLEEWAEAVRDYEILRKELPGDSEVAESLSRAQDALMKLRRGDAYVKPGDFFGSDHYKAVMHSPGKLSFLVLKIVLPCKFYVLSKYKYSDPIPRVALRLH